MDNQTKGYLYEVQIRDYIINELNTPVYLWCDTSEMLLLKMYNDIHQDQTPYEAPHWRKLKEYGGELSIDEFRDSFNKIEYKNHGFIMCKKLSKE